MPKKKQQTSSSSNKKKSITSIDKNSAKKTSSKLDNKKMMSISEQITKMNNKFENLIGECKIALIFLSKTQAA